jgi:hypothetical protein
MFTKSGIMVGLGEDRQSVLQVMDDMRAADVDFLTIGQYLQPTPKHHAVDRFVTSRGIRRLREGGLWQGLPHGLGHAADAVELPCGRRFRTAARFKNPFIGMLAAANHDLAVTKILEAFLNEGRRRFGTVSGPAPGA